MNAITMVWVLTWPRFIIPRHLKDRGSAPGGGWPASALAMDGETVRGYSHPQNLAEITLFRVFANRTAGWSSKHACLSMQNKTIWIATTISTTRLSRGLASKPSFGIFWGGANWAPIEKGILRDPPLLDKPRPLPNSAIQRQLQGDTITIIVYNYLKQIKIETHNIV